MAGRVENDSLFNIEDLIKEAWAPKLSAPLPHVRRVGTPTALSSDERRELAFALSTYLERRHPKDAPT